MPTSNKWIFITIGIVVVVFAGLFWAIRSAPGVTGDLDGIACLPNGHANLAQHIHPELKIIDNGFEKTPPANIGITQSCMRWLHTHDASGIIHLETPDARTLTLGQFMSVWKAHGGYFMDGRKVTNVTVDGQDYTGDYAQIVLKDKQKIVLTLDNQTI